MTKTHHDKCSRVDWPDSRRPGGRHSGGDLAHRGNRRPAADRTELNDAIEAVDGATGDGPAYYMINCAHPTHFEDALTQGESWLERIRGLRANACHTHRAARC